MSIIVQCSSKLYGNVSKKLVLTNLLVNILCSIVILIINFNQTLTRFIQVLDLYLLEVEYTWI